MTPKTRAYLAALLIALGLDLGTKSLARWKLAPRSPEVVTVIPNLFELQFAENPGAAFNSLQSGGAMGRVILLGVGALGFALSLAMLRKLEADQRLLAASLALIGAGALGNLIDRALFGKVTDFILWRFGDFRWPNFNVADAALVVGVGVLVVSGFASSKVPRARRLA